MSATISAGVPFGASITVQLARSNSGTPASLKVGTFGSAVERVSPVTAIGLTEPPSIAAFPAATPP